MSTRSRQAAALARELSTRTGTPCLIQCTGHGEWLIQWTHGPTSGEVRGLVRGWLESGRYPELAGQQLNTSRHWGPIAWTARAVAAAREGGLGPAVEQGAAWRRDLGPLPIRGALPPEERALRAYVEDLIDRTADPDRASGPADEAAIELLLAASDGSEERMAALVLAGGDAAGRGELPQGVTPLRRRPGRQAGPGQRP